MKPPAKHTFTAIGTEWSIETDEPLSTDELRQIDQEIDDFSHAYSRFLDDSLVTQVARQSPGSFTFPASITELYDYYVRLEDVTKGAVNPLVGKSLEQLGYDAQYSLQPSSTPYIPPSFTSTVKLSGTQLTSTSPVLIDIGAIGKGYLVDKLAALIALNHADYIVDGSGDIIVRSSAPEIIGLEDPRDSSKIIGTVSLSDKSLCASAINRRTWGNNLHHVIDGRTGLPSTTDIIATWAIADSTILADALTTALFFTPVSQLQIAFGDFFYVTMELDGSVEHNIDTIGEIYV